MIIVCDNCGKKNRVPAASSGTPQCGNCHSPLAWIAEAGDRDFADVVESRGFPCSSTCGRRGAARATW